MASLSTSTAASSGQGGSATGSAGSSTTGVSMVASAATTTVGSSVAPATTAATAATSAVTVGGGIGPSAVAGLAAKDNVAREAILSGVPAQDAEMICQEDTAQAMWNRFVDKQTKREYSNYIFARAEFYSNVYTSEKSMDQWLREMESMRRQLLHYGKCVTDDDYAETLLGHVARTHRDVVRQFSKHYVVRHDGGADRPVPTATQVMNALRAESALDEKIGTEEQKPVGVAACGKKSTPPKQKQDNQGRAKRKRAGRKNHQKEGKQGSRSNAKKSDKEEPRTCFHCGEVGHLRPNCPERADSSDDESAGKGFATSERKRWQNKSSNQNDNKKKRVSAVGRFSRETLVVSSVSDSHGDDVEWALDSASDVHVCNRPDVLLHLYNDSAHVFQGYDGSISGGEKVGNVQIRVRNNKQPHQDVSLQLEQVLYKPSAPDNLLSLDVMEKDCWNLKTGFRDSQRVAWLSKGRLQLLLTLPLEQPELPLVRLMLLMFVELGTLMLVAPMVRILLVLGVQLLEVVSLLLLPQMLSAAMLSHLCFGTSDSLT
ncbi:hypothetical protein PF002_g6981 [Phytophthora fragariae]|uniref:CCHC-type domain-containing protein n=2 Tax=Phytophthora fragariae TaxID=53985 RepID=A0A6A3ZZA8_9STRA|nr:hypothetical protein PF004_g19421 [Phytophthora fragariae]KAE9245972.1 hypothetical protein PF002_g6981 [Phytophthora fragariae]